MRNQAFVEAIAKDKEFDIPKVKNNEVDQVLQFL